MSFFSSRRDQFHFADIDGTKSLAIKNGIVNDKRSAVFYGANTSIRHDISNQMVSFSRLDILVDREREKLGDRPSSE